MTSTLPADPYRWLEDADDPAVASWTARQTERTLAELAPLPGQQAIVRTLRGLLTRPPASAPKRAGTRRFRVARVAGGASYSVEVRDVLDGVPGEWRTVVGAGQLPDHSRVSRWVPSPSGRRIAVQVVVRGNEQTTPLLVVDVDTSTVLDTIELCRYAPVEWRADDERFYYVRRHVEGPGHGVYLHAVGTATPDDALLVGDAEPMGRYAISLWHDRWLVIARRRGTGPTTSRTMTDLTTGDCVDIGASSAPLLVDSAGRLLQTDDTVHVDGIVQVADSPAGAAAGRWRELVAGENGAVLRSITLVPGGARDLLALLRSRDAISALDIVDAATGRPVTSVALPGEGTVAALSPGEDPGTLVVAYTDWTTPLSLWHVDAHTGECRPSDGPVSRQEVTVVRDTYRAPDGTDVPITVLRRTDDDGSAPQPLLLTCYGGFGITVNASFQPDSLAWILCGGRMAIAGIRGGGDRGRRWHRAGAGPNKPTGFADLHAAGDWLVEQGWTRRDQLALLGGSNGGMMVTGAVAQRPGAYAAVAAVGAPLDMVRYPHFGIGRAWLGEYGDPDDAAALDVLLSFSPYHNVGRGTGRWPAALFSVGSNDTRVDPMHSRKMVARLQDETAGRGPVVLKVVDGSGHVSVLNADTERLAGELLAFLAKHTGLTLQG